MKFKFDKLSFATTMVFLTAFICLMFSYLTYAMFYPTLALLCAGTTMLTIKLAMGYKQSIKNAEIKKEELVMELSAEDGTNYVLKEEKDKKKAMRKERRQKFDLMLPTLGCAFLALLFAFFLIRVIFKF